MQEKTKLKLNTVHHGIEKGLTIFYHDSGELIIMTENERNETDYYCIQKEKAIELAKFILENQ